ncbi:RagB/SusD family nutrient uptake outer membrane protein [Olleya sp. Bg11-27]|uniref:RagB/SusD family nutrient uptake outer membrane protein n=1 Tax=Olleya sp. Bg11-27 TaxID=2058135 RepID=UPI000C30ADA6|nr:RagB/SusD family nutrient uptake outer membrane protein [Olleya sp. Bg11-27]AUC77488.1 RagB/SusD family nutrient uptake outer membrane protein [Olleya sp. Bg11-27]
MKNIFKTLFLLLLVITFNSCEKELEQLPNDSVSPDSYYSNIGEMEAAMRGVYRGFVFDDDGNTEDYYGASYASRPDILADNVILTPAGRDTNRSFFEWNYQPNLAWDILYAPYVVTNRVNLILSNMDRIPAGSDKDNIIGEARAARALALFDAVRVYSQIPTQSTGANASLGLPIITGIDPAVVATRPTVESNYNFIITELLAARDLIASDNGSGRFNKNAVNALLSRAYLYNGDYLEAINAANAVTSAVAPMSTFAGIWTDASEDGVLLKINQDRILDNIGIGIEWSQSVSPTLIPEYAMSFELSNLYQTTDVRRSAYTLPQTDSDGNLYNSIIKMFGEAGQSNGAVDAKILRTAEVYLNKAEAHAMRGEFAQALTALDEVRSNRYSGFVSPAETGATLIDAIKLERRLEFFAESHRFFDLKRWNESVTRSATDGDFFDGTGTPAAQTSLPAGNFKFQLPIPQRETNINPALQQNPGY